MKPSPVDQTVDFVRRYLADAEAGHDWWHIRRVWNNVKLLLRTEQADPITCELAALLHDIADSKFHDGDESLAPRIAGEFLGRIGVSTPVIEHVRAIILHMSFKSGFGQGSSGFRSHELEIVQDADRLDAIGAIGIARAFHYGGFRNRELYNPDVVPNPMQDKEAYKNSTAPTINHFYEKLLLLKDRMNTEAAKQIATERHDFMERYLTQFYREWDGLDVR